MIWPKLSIPSPIFRPAQTPQTLCWHSGMKRDWIYLFFSFYSPALTKPFRCDSCELRLPWDLCTVKAEFRPAVLAHFIIIPGLAASCQVAACPNIAKPVPPAPESQLHLLFLFLFFCFFLFFSECIRPLCGVSLATTPQNPQLLNQTLTLPRSTSSPTSSSS
jgi:hypothetical protein